MQILAINCGSSSIKCALIDTETARRSCEMRAEEIGRPNARLQTTDGSRQLGESATFEQAADMLLEQMRSTSAALGAIEAVAHRIVHGGERFVQPTRLNEASLRELDAVSKLAPLHNLTWPIGDSYKARNV